MTAGPYWCYDEAGHAVCNAHILRDLDDVGARRGQEEWTEAMTECLLEARRRAETAMEAGDDEVPIGVRNWLRGRYNAALAQAFVANPEPVGRKRNANEKAAYNLAVALEYHVRGDPGLPV